MIRLLAFAPRAQRGAPVNGRIARSYVLGCAAIVALASSFAHADTCAEPDALCTPLAHIAGTPTKPSSDLGWLREGVISLGMACRGGRYRLRPISGGRAAATMDRLSIGGVESTPPWKSTCTSAHVQTGIRRRRARPTRRDRLGTVSARAGLARRAPWTQWRRSTSSRCGRPTAASQLCWGCRDGRRHCAQGRIRPASVGRVSAGVRSA
jgi:hypothetical protein